MSKKKKEWKAEKGRLLSLGTEDRRKDYRGKYLILDNIPSWANHDSSTEDKEQKSGCLAHKVSLYRGDITILEVDAIVNAANSSLLGGGGVDGCIHRAAGHLLFEECHSLNGCDTGKAKITCGYDLPAKYVIHTVGPIARGNVGQSQRDDLESCYKNSLKLVKEYNLRSVAFPCISTGIYGFPNEPAADIALTTVKDWVQGNINEIDRVVFCVFLETDYEIYKSKMSDFFPSDNDGREEEEAKMEDNTQTEAGEAEELPSGEIQEDVEMMSQTEDVCEQDMASQNPDENPDVESSEQGNEKHDQGDSKVEDSPPIKRKTEEGNKEKEKEEEKKEDKAGDPEVAGENTGESPGKMQKGQTDPETKPRKDAEKSEIRSNKETTISIKVQDKSSPEPETASADSVQSKDGEKNLHDDQKKE